MFGEFLTYPVYALTPSILDGGGGAYCLFVYLLLQDTKTVRKVRT